MIYSQNNSRKMGIILSYLLIIVQAVVSLIYVPMLLNIIGKNEYGLYQLMGSLISYFSIMDFGLSGAIIRYYSIYQSNNEKNNMANVLGTSKIIYRVLTIILCILALILYFNLDSIFSQSLSAHELTESKNIFILLTVNICLTLLTNIHTAVITSHERFVFLKGISIIQVILQPIIVYLLILNHPFAFVVAATQTGLNLILAFFKVGYCKFNLKMKSKFLFFDKKLILGMLKLSTSIFIVSIVDQIFWKTNQFILGIISGTSAVAIYSIASQIYLNYMPLSSAIQNVFLPYISKNISLLVKKENITNLFIRIGRIQYLILSLVLFGFLTFGKEFIILWAGKEYTMSYYIAIVILFPFTIDLIENIGLTILQSLNKYNVRAKVYSFTAILNMLLVLVLGSRYGAIGCGIGTGISMFIGSGIMMNIYYCIKLNINILLFFKNIISLSIVPFLLSIFFLVIKLYFPINNFISLFLFIIFFSILYIFLNYIFFMNEYEKEIIHKFKNKVCKN